MTHQAASPDLPRWRFAAPPDFDAIDRIADNIHKGLPERSAVLREKHQLFPGGCMILTRNGEAVGYGLSHPWKLGEIPALGAFLGHLPSRPDCIYVHDVAINSDMRGHASAGAYIDLIASQANILKIAALALVSVHNTEPVWARYGFKTTFTPTIVQKLGSYGETAKYMVSSLPGPD